jgi:asparagine synthase (glutamine-hydrolysing)
VCGICGKLIHDPGGRVEPALVEDMTLLLAHRGPDDRGTWDGGHVGLGHRRLSIIDLGGGHQPIANEDGSAVIVYNGEVYNHAELRRDLEQRGHVYRTRTDTETILHAYEEYGPSCVERFRGMFAFAIWDDRRKRLFLARDRFGIKPLYYHERPGGIVFASEIKAILADPDVMVTPDAAALYDYFTHKFIPGPRTPYREIKRLQPAHWMTVEHGRVTVEQYWHPRLTPSRGTEPEHLERLDDLLTESIREHLMSEVPQGVFLSGGVDSSLITALNAGLVNEPLRTFSVGFGGRRGFDETSFAEQAAHAFGTGHRVFECTPADADSLPDIFWHVEEPLADAAMIPLHRLCREASREVTVVHCGDGGDEGFGGYTRFFWDRYAGLMAGVPRPVREGVILPLARLAEKFPGRAAEFARRVAKFTRFAALPDAERYMNWFTLIDDATKRGFMTPDFLGQVGAHRSAEAFEASFAEAAAFGLDPFATRQYCELSRFVPDDLMLKSDKIAMASGLEGRFPFLDHRLVEFGMSLPPNHKIRGGETKVLLKKLLARHLPKSFVHRRKQGFEVPVTDWFKGGLDAALLDEVDSDDDGILDKNAVRALADRMHRGDPAAGRQLFVVFMYRQWRRVFRNPKAACLERLRALR